MLRLDNLNIWHSVDDKRVPIANALSFDVEPGTVLGIVGPNGSGKTTLLRAVAGLHLNRSGSIEFEGKTMSDVTLAYLPQNYRQAFFPWATLLQNLALNMEDGRQCRAKLVAASELLGLDIDLNLKPHQASGGMLQQVNLAWAVARKSPLILADEPFAALDISSASKLRNRFREHVQNNRSVAVLVLHDPVEIMELCDKVLIVPDRPFTTALGQPDFHQAEVLDRSKARGRATLTEREKVSFVDAMKLMLNA